MKKAIILSLLLFVFIVRAKAQSTISQQEFGDLIAVLNKEDWEKVDPVLKDYLDRIPKQNVNDGQAAILRYMYITAQSGLMYSKKLSKDEALKKVKKFEGLTILRPWNTLSSKQRLNMLSPHNNTIDTLFITQTNKAGTDLYSFEYIALAEKLDKDHFDKMTGSLCRVLGTINSITVEGNMFPRFKMKISDAKLEFKEAPMK
ncbi:hypothetical protein IM792_05570 [Mucilaginibacter sp. JRF]|uniref:hypothetical protein n=1 Tax=Mucilaginibacter sp. JRF TaxID=2780088 RepID=UPI00187EFAA2|nr:hypothetical protein [Mucilaginibacter sp. JRF]MBE9583909.1 hypothetical protein [Mucilaginibacter sp. JRF]